MAHDCPGREERAATPLYVTSESKSISSELPVGFVVKCGSEHEHDERFQTVAQQQEREPAGRRATRGAGHYLTMEEEEEGRFGHRNAAPRWSFQEDHNRVSTAYRKTIILP